MIPRERLAALIRPPAEEDERPQRIPYPTASGSLYAPPNPDGSRKTCSCCWKFLFSSGTCLEVGGTLDPQGVCGYHAYGKPQATKILIGAQLDSSAPNRQYTKEEAGYIPTPHGGGTSCDNCRFFQPTQDKEGLCNALAADDGWPPIIVEERGCCARWEFDPNFIPGP